MLSNSWLNRSFWVEAVNTTCYLVNRSLSITIDFKTPGEVWSNKPIDYSMLKVFKCQAYYHANEHKKGVFMGYENGVKGFKIWSL